MVKSALPGPSVPPVAQDGNWNTAWYQYFQAEHNRTGGNSTDLIESTFEDATASGLFQAVQGSTSAGAMATIILQVRAGIAEAFRSASIKLSALAGVSSRIELTADTIQLDGTVLSNGGILSGHLASEAATIHKVVTVNGPITPTAPQVNTWINLATLPTFTSTGNPIEVNGQFMLHNTDAGSPGTHHYGVRIQRNGSTVWPSVAPTYGSDGGSYFNQPVKWVETPGAGTVTYTLDYFPDSTSCDAVNIVLSADEIKR